MTAVIGLLLLSVTDGVVTHCDGRQSSVQCYGALGGAVSLQLIDNFSQLNKNKETPNPKYMVLINKGKNEKFQSISSVFPSNGTVLIHNLSRNDSGECSLMIYNSDGLHQLTQTVQLLVQAPVSSVWLDSECLSQGEMKVSCSSQGGDSLQYRWTLNGKSLTEAELLSGNNQTNIITLKQHVSGRVICSVWNHISSTSNQTNIHTCGFIYINCTFNGKKISKWVFKENNTLCDEPTQKAPPTETHTYTFFNQSVNLDQHAVHTDSSVLRCSLIFLFSVVSFVGIAVYFKWKKIKLEKVEQSAARHTTRFSEDFCGNEHALYCNIPPKSWKLLSGEA